MAWEAAERYRGDEDMKKPTGRGTLTRRARVGGEAGMAGPSGSQIERRQARRISTAYNGVCRLGTVSFNVEIIDLSTSGARVRIRHGLVPREGQHATLKLMSGKVMECEVIRSDGSEIGVRFISPIQDVDDVLHFDEMGAEFYKCILRFQVVTR